MVPCGERLQSHELGAVSTGTHHYFRRHRCSAAITRGVGKAELSQRHILCRLYLQVGCLGGSTAPVGHVVCTIPSVQQVLQASLALAVVVGQAEGASRIGGQGQRPHCRNSNLRKQFPGLLRQCLQLLYHEIVLVHTGGSKIPPRTVVVPGSVIPSHHLATGIGVQRHLVLVGLALQCPQGIAQVKEPVCLGRSLCIRVGTDLLSPTQCAQILARTYILYIICILCRSRFQHPLLCCLGQIGCSGMEFAVFVQVHGLAGILLVGKHIRGTRYERHTVVVSGKNPQVFLVQQVVDGQICLGILVVIGLPGIPVRLHEGGHPLGHEVSGMCLAG